MKTFANSSTMERHVTPNDAVSHISVASGDEVDLEIIVEREGLKIEKAKQKIAEAIQKKAELKAEEDDKLRIQKAEFIANHQHYLEQATLATDPKEEQKFRRWAADELANANEIIVDGFDQPAPIIVEKPWKERAFKWLFTHFGSWIIQILLLAGMATFCYNKVVTESASILKKNEYFANSGQTTMMIAPPLDEKDIQQIWFDKYQLIGDIGFALFILLVLAPHILLTLLPFIKLPKNLWLSYQSIPELQKQWLSFAWSVLVLFLVVTAHPHK